MAAKSWYNHDVDFWKFKVFDCDAYLLRETSDGKFNSKSNKHIFVGYSPHGYWLWNINECKIIEGRDIICKKHIIFDNKFNLNSDNINNVIIPDDIKDTAPIVNVNDIKI